MEWQFDESKLENRKLCSECGGKCCNRCGCAYFPKDFKFKLNFENLKSEIDKGYISIDAIQYIPIYQKCYDRPVYYLRVRNVTDDTPIGIDKLGRCKCLEGDHCTFKIKDRPSGGKYFVPFWSGCYTLYTYQEFLDTWMPYQEVLILLLKYYEK